MSHDPALDAAWSASGRSSGFSQGGMIPSRVPAGSVHTHHHAVSGHGRARASPGRCTRGFFGLPNARHSGWTLASPTYAAECRSASTAASMSRRVRCIARPTVTAVQLYVLGIAAGLCARTRVSRRFQPAPGTPNGVRAGIGACAVPTPARTHAPEIGLHAVSVLAPMAATHRAWHAVG